MRWLNKAGKIAKEASVRKLGDVKYKLRFAWKPVRIGGETVWLETYYEKYTWSRYISAWLGQTRVLRSADRSDATC